MEYCASTSVGDLGVISVRQRNTMQVKGEAKTLFWEIEVQPSGTTAFSWPNVNLSRPLIFKTN